jgi:probable selenium-dependent hydroxylase accessory protein YqeC
MAGRRDRGRGAGFCLLARAIRGTMDEAGARMLLDVLSAGRGVVCAVGAGGKKSTLYRLAEAHRVAGSARVAFTATVMVAAPPVSLFGEPLIGQGEDLAQQLSHALAERRLVAYAGPSSKPGRLGGLAPERVADLHARHRLTATLVKADGARMRLIKAPAEDEPVLPPGTATVLPVISARAIGRPLDLATAHRPDRVARITGAAPGEPLAPIHLARLLAAGDGALHRAGDAIVVPIINMVDDPKMLLAARETARQALAMTRRFERVVLAAMTAAEPLIEVVERRTGN